MAVQLYCNDCGIVHAPGERCKIGCFYDMKISIGFCPHCIKKYRGDSSEPVEVWVPWEQRKVWESCWDCFIRKLEK